MDSDNVEPAFSVATGPEEAEALDEMLEVGRDEDWVFEGVGLELALDEGEEFVVLGLGDPVFDSLEIAGAGAGAAGAAQEETVMVAASRSAAFWPKFRYFKRSPFRQASSTELSFRLFWCPRCCGIPRTKAMMPSARENPRYSANYVASANWSREAPSPQTRLLSSLRTARWGRMTSTS